MKKRIMIWILCQHEYGSVTFHIILTHTTILIFIIFKIILSYFYHMIYILLLPSNLRKILSNVTDKFYSFYWTDFILVTVPIILVTESITFLLLNPLFILVTESIIFLLPKLLYSCYWTYYILLLNPLYSCY